MIYALFEILDIILRVATWIIFGQVILSWLIAFNVLNMGSDFVRQLVYGLERITAPVYRPIKRMMPDFGGIDFSPLVVLLIILFLRKLLVGVALELGPTIS